MADRIPTEHEEQREFVRWFRLQYPGVRIFATPNGGSRNPATAGRLKAEGVSKGVPDLYVPAWKMWIEMKRTKGGALSADQKDWIAYLHEIGDTALVTKGCEDAVKQVIEFFSRNRFDATRNNQPKHKATDDPDYD